MKITKTRLKEIIKEEVEKIVVNEVDVAQQGLTQARKDVVSGVSPEEKEEISNLTNMFVAYAKKKNLLQGRVGQLLDFIKKEMDDRMREGSEEELDEMSTAGGVTASVEGAPSKRIPVDEQ